MRRACCITLALFLASLIGFAQTASIQGKVTSGDTKTPLPKTFVTAVKKGLPAASKSVPVAADGSFQIPSLAAGMYSLCIDAPGFLDPCQWNLPTTVVQLRDGQSSTGNALTVNPGVITKLRLQDPSVLLAAQTKDGRTPNVLAGIWSGENTLLPTGKPSGIPTLPQLHHFLPVSQDSTGADYQIALPPGASLRFYITSHDLLLGDSQGAALATNEGSEPFVNVAAGATARQFTYTVVGQRP
jgi:hypothetical protein